MDGAVLDPFSVLTLRTRHKKQCRVGFCTLVSAGFFLVDGVHLCVSVQPMKQISAIAAFKKGYIMRKNCVEPDGRKSK